MKNTQTQTVIGQLREARAPLWKRIARDLSKPTRQRRIVNVFKIDKHAQDGDVVIIPGKVLGEGTLTKKVTVAAQSFSDSAREKINACGKAVTIQELMESHPKGERVRILG